MYGRKNQQEIAITEALSPHLFWDIDPEQQDFDTCPAQIIQRMLEYAVPGTLSSPPYSPKGCKPLAKKRVHPVGRHFYEWLPTGTSCPVKKKGCNKPLLDHIFKSVIRLQIDLGSK